mgnify:CR=1 FL=1|tara:strand:- start:341 stop:532 length:192 start_codon:yes stop_codon:yes gene_type:complete
MNCNFNQVKKYGINAGKKGSKYKVSYFDPFTGKVLKTDKGMAQKIAFMLTMQNDDEEYEVVEI